MIRLIIFTFVALLMLGCKNNPSDSWPDLDLMKDGVPLKIKAPEDAVVEVSNMGMLKDITIKSGDHFALQILSSESMDSDIEKLVREELLIVKSNRYFSKIISQEEHGFIFEKKIDDIINYDFRYFRIQGNNEFDFQRALMGNFSLEDVQTMYAAVQK